MLLYYLLDIIVSDGKIQNIGKKEDYTELMVRRNG